MGNIAIKLFFIRPHTTKAIRKQVVDGVEIGSIRDVARGWDEMSFTIHSPIELKWGRVQSCWLWLWFIMSLAKLIVAKKKKTNNDAYITMAIKQGVHYMSHNCYPHSLKCTLDVKKNVLNVLSDVKKH